jgi:DnaJ-class molecular chaperone
MLMTINVVDYSLHPEKYPHLTECPHCHGFGSSLKDPEGVDTCTRCYGTGIVRHPDWEE